MDGSPGLATNSRRLGSPCGHVVANRIFLLGQLGKYLPGSVWTVLAQAELAGTEGVPRTRAGAASLIGIFIQVLSAALLGSACMVVAGRDILGGYVWAVAVVLGVGVLLHPRLLHAILQRLARLTHRPIADTLLSFADVGVAMNYGFAGQVANGVQLWLLAGGVSGRYPPLLLAIGLFSLAAAVGVVVIIAPAGVGVREVILIAGLTQLMSPAWLCW